MLPLERRVYSAIAERLRPRLPNGARFAVWVNIEAWDALKPMPRTVLPPVSALSFDRTPDCF